MMTVSQIRNSLTAAKIAVWRTVFQGNSPSGDLGQICDETKETCAQILIPHERTFILALETRLVHGRGDAVYLKFWVKVIALE